MANLKFNDWKYEVRNDYDALSDWIDKAKIVKIRTQFGFYVTITKKEARRWVDSMELNNTHFIAGVDNFDTDRWFVFICEA